MPYYLSLLVISLVGIFFLWKKIDFKGIPRTDYVGKAKVYRLAEHITLTCALLSFVAPVVSIVLRLDIHPFDFCWWSIALVQLLFWVFIYFGFVKPQLHEYENQIRWDTR